MARELVKSNIRIEQARIGFRNFTGREGKYNPKGIKNFCIFLDDDLAKTLGKDGWNVKLLDPREEGDRPQPILPVTVAYRNFPPKIVMIRASSGTQEILEEGEVHILDWAEIINVDLVVRPYNWEINEKFGVKAYLKTMYITIAEDEFESKYRNVPSFDPDSFDDEKPPWDD